MTTPTFEEHHFCFATHEANGLRFNVGSIGDPANPMIICLHGFPEFWRAWSRVATELADAYFIVVPDQRGFNLSSKPEGVDAYRTRHMVADLAAIADVYSPNRPFVLAGHDWGASVAYAYAFALPHRLSRLVVANGVHPVCFQRAILQDAGQRLASQYINRLRADDAEGLLSQDRYRRLIRMIEHFSRAGFMDHAMRLAYIEAWSRPGALTGMLNWYRAAPLLVPEPDAIVTSAPILDMAQAAFAVKMPHLVLWGEEDQALLPACLEGLEAFAPDLTIQRIEGASHWLLHEKPLEVASRNRAFLS